MEMFYTAFKVELLCRKVLTVLLVSETGLVVDGQMRQFNKLFFLRHFFIHDIIIY